MVRLAVTRAQAVRVMRRRLHNNLAKCIAGGHPSTCFDIVMEMVLAERDADLAGTPFDMQMFMGTEVHERTNAECM